ncbi:MAG: aquaporin family protein [Nocardiopsaceae bacterium]|nr:aquaporin family protein [Nocardiopsaceae bacterium]
MADITPLRGEGRTVGRITGLYGELLSEFLGTLVILAFGDGVVGMAVAALPGSGRAASPTTIFMASGDWLLITWGWAMAVAFGVWVAGGVSGAHLNPAITLAFAVRRKFSWRKVVPYWIAQVAGAFVGAAIVLMVYNSAINAFNLASHTPRGSGKALDTFSIFATFPAPYFHGSIPGPLIDQVVGTAFLLIFVVALTDLRNSAVGSGLAPFGIGLAVAAIGMSYGANAGYAINPARDFGPRLLAYIAGWGKTALPGDYSSGTGWSFSGYFWIPIVGPIIGAIVGVVIYDLFIGDVLHARLKKSQDTEGPIPESRTASAVESELSVRYKPDLRAARSRGPEV